MPDKQKYHCKLRHCKRVCESLTYLVNSVRTTTKSQAYLATKYYNPPLSLSLSLSSRLVDASCSVATHRHGASQYRQRTDSFNDISHQRWVEFLFHTTRWTKIFANPNIETKLNGFKTPDGSVLNYFLYVLWNDLWMKATLMINLKFLKFFWDVFVGIQPSIGSLLVNSGVIMWSLAWSLDLKSRHEYYKSVDNMTHLLFVTA